MKRYQVYLNSNSVSVLDDFEDKTNVSRSAIIRMAVNSLAQNMLSLLPSNINQISKGPLEELIGLIKTDSKNTNDSSIMVDDIYYGK